MCLTVAISRQSDVGRKTTFARRKIKGPRNPWILDQRHVLGVFLLWSVEKFLFHGKKYRSSGFRIFYKAAKRVRLSHFLDQKPILNIIFNSDIIGTLVSPLTRRFTKCWNCSNSSLTQKLYHSNPFSIPKNIEYDTKHVFGRRASLTRLLLHAAMHRAGSAP